MAASTRNASNSEFKPTQEELILRYLRRKVNGESLPDDAVLECDLFGEKNPWDIWELFKHKSSNNGRDLYFFTRLKKKFANGSRAARTIGCGSWEGENAPKSIGAIGYKKRYRFEKSHTEQDGRWIIHEYSLDSSLVRDESGSNYVLCRFRKNNRNARQKKARKRKEREDAKHKNVVLGLQAITLSNDDNGVVHEGNRQKKATIRKRKVQAAMGEKSKVMKSSIKIEFAVESHPGKVEDDERGNSTPWAQEFAEELLSTLHEDEILVEEDVCLIPNPFSKDLWKITESSP